MKIATAHVSALSYLLVWSLVPGSGAAPEANINGNADTTTTTITTTTTTTTTTRPNILILQPDDFKFLDEWTPPPNTPDNPDLSDPFPDNDGKGLPNIESLRLNGLQMMQAYAASPMCGTSRFSTITGRMPTRAASVRADSQGCITPWVTIPYTKLVDLDGQNDCSEENIAVAFRNGGYETAIMGKWHLSRIDKETYTYDTAVETVKKCGFNTVEALYIENMANGEDKEFDNFSDGTFSHNMEWIVYEAIKVINATSKTDAPFFMYLNPTVPHGSRDIRKALTEYTCRDIADANYAWDSDPWIKGMSEDGGCAQYRQTILDRAKSDDDLGKIWLDDSIGALLTALKDSGQLDNTIFLFQEDHGVAPKGTLYEGGLRIPQFVHYPDKIAPSTTFEGLVSTVDIAATMLDYAGITPPYEIDGKSWKDAIDDPIEEFNWKYNRCLFFELEHDRAARCGCYKHLNIVDTEWSTTYSRGETRGLDNTPYGVVYDLCDGTDEYITDNDNNMERAAYEGNQINFVQAMEEMMECHLERTKAEKDSDYSECEFPIVQTPPTASPSPPVASCTDSPLKVKKYKTCAKVSQKNKCGTKKFWSHCRATCGKCDKCQDSALKLTLAKKVKHVFEEDGETVTKKTKTIKCKHVRKANNKKGLCKKSDIAASCPKTCGGC
mmetsp:Transcript_20506/g.43459  ORF Transcript_20506/g.43459 Transcript_20506/m.43459 type:complete len:666 (-) Transcript_20506:1559-3556(-)